MTAEHHSYEEVARPLRNSGEYHEGYAEARRAFLIAQAVRERRRALGLSQVELAARAGMTQPALARLEAGRCGAYGPITGTDQRCPGH
jgi:ribosome-binding protein aMBF1 (putative translation factor)